MRTESTALPPPPGWVPPRRTLIIAAAPRSGSSWLGDIVGETGVMGRPEEWFGWWRTDRKRERTIEAAHDVAARGATPNGIAGLKLLPYYLETALQHIRLGEWFPDAVWVHLQRRDLLAQAISLWRARGSGTWSESGTAVARQAGVPEGRPGFDPVSHYDARGIELCLRQSAAFHADWIAFFARTGITPLSFVYEDVLADPAPMLAAIAAALGVVVPADVAAPKSRFRVQRDEASEAIRARFLRDAGDPDRPTPLLMPVNAAGFPAGRTKPPAPTLANAWRLLTRRPLKPR